MLPPTRADAFRSLLLGAVHFPLMFVGGCAVASLAPVLSDYDDLVLAHGWAYGEGGNALKGKACLWVTTTGAPPADYTHPGKHKHPFEAFAPLIEMTARYCGMRWLLPIVVHGAHLIDDAALQGHASRYRETLISSTGEGARG